jgi:hypothetical protein
LDAFSDGIIRAVRETVDDQLTTAFPFPSVRPLKNGKYSEPLNEIPLKNSRSRHSMVRLERHDSTTSSSSGSNNGASGENDTSDIGSEKVEKARSRKYTAPYVGQYHTREGYPKAVGSIKKLNTLIRSADGKVEQFEDMTEENIIPMVIVKECDLETVSNNTETKIYEHEFNCDNIHVSENNKTSSPTTPTSFELPNSPVQITTLPSIPKRSTYRVELQPGVILPERKLFLLK